MTDIDETPRWIRDFYNSLWFLLKVLLIIGIIAAILFVRVAFDGWYVNWLMK